MSSDRVAAYTLASAMSATDIKRPYRPGPLRRPPLSCWTELSGTGKGSFCDSTSGDSDPQQYFTDGLEVHSSF